MPVHEIARRAGVGTGTVSRHFPTKEALFEAIVADRVGRIFDRLRATSDDPELEFTEFLTVMISEGTANRGLAESFAGAGYDMDAAARAAGYDFDGLMREHLDRAKRAGLVRQDIEFADLKALMAGCMTRTGPDTDPAHAKTTLDRMISILRQGLRPSSRRPSRRAA